MNQSVGEQINSVINNLAEKLGVAVDKVYPMLIKQAYMDGIVSAIFMIIGIIMCIAPYIGYRIVTKKDKNDNYIAYGWDEGWYGFGAIFLIVFLIGLGLIFTNISITVNAFGNPEWYAIQQIINQLKK